MGYRKGWADEKPVVIATAFFSPRAGVVSPAAAEDVWQCPWYS